MVLTFANNAEELEDDGSAQPAAHASSDSSIDRLTDRRAIQRHPVVLAASAEVIDGSSSLVIANLSSQGARLKGPNPPTAEREVLITTGTFAVFAIVAWSEQDECGLRFVPPLDHHLLTEFEQEGKWGTVMGTI